MRDQKLNMAKSTGIPTTADKSARSDPSSGSRIVLIEDDPDLAYTIGVSLRREEGWRVDHFASGLEAIEAIRGHACDLVLLDLNLPDVDGLSVCRALRQEPKTRSIPVIMLTARAEERDKLLGFDLGADDYVTKPFSMKELIARIKAQLRRSSETTGSGELFESASLRVDRSSFSVIAAGLPVHLTKKEFDLLWLLIQSRPRVLTRETILSRVWDYHSAIETRTVDAHIRSLRRKIGDAAIETIVGVGYRFQESP